MPAWLPPSAPSRTWAGPQRRAAAGAAGCAPLAGAAGELEGHDHVLPGADVGDLVADVDDFSDRFVTEGERIWGVGCRAAKHRGVEIAGGHGQGPYEGCGRPAQRGRVDVASRDASWRLEVDGFHSRLLVCWFQMVMATVPVLWPRST